MKQTSDGIRALQLRRTVWAIVFYQFSVVYLACSQGGVTGDDGVTIPFYPQIYSNEPGSLQEDGLPRYDAEYRCTVVWHSNELASQVPDAGQTEGALFLSARLNYEQFLDTEDQPDLNGLVGRRNGTLVQLSLGVSGALWTTDRSLDEEFSGIAKVSPGLVYLNVPIDVESLGGAFTVDSSNLVGAALNLQFRDNNTAEGQFEGYWKDNQRAEHFRLTFAHLRCTVRL